MVASVYKLPTKLKFHSTCVPTYQDQPPEAKAGCVGFYYQKEWERMLEVEGMMMVDSLVENKVHRHNDLGLSSDVGPINE